MQRERTTYKDAGVDIDAGNSFVSLIKPLVKATFRPEVMTEIGGFGGLFSLNASKYKNPVLVSGTDGVGTKLKLAFELDRHDTIGIDLVAMSVNDVSACGAVPLFFLDYLVVGKVVPEEVADMVAYLDKTVGQVVSEIDKLGIRENTLIVFSGDNGTARESGKAHGRQINGAKPHCRKSYYRR